MVRSHGVWWRDNPDLVPEGSVVFSKVEQDIKDKQKTTKNRCQHRIRKTARKKPPKIRFWDHFGLPKTSEKPPKSLPEAMLNEACFATLCKSPGSRLQC